MNRISEKESNLSNYLEARIARAKVLRRNYFPEIKQRAQEAIEELSKFYLATQGRDYFSQEQR